MSLFQLNLSLITCSQLEHYTNHSFGKAKVTRYKSLCILATFLFFNYFLLSLLSSCDSLNFLLLFLHFSFCSYCDQFFPFTFCLFLAVSFFNVLAHIISLSGIPPNRCVIRLNSGLLQINPFVFPLIISEHFPFFLSTSLVITFRFPSFHSDE